MPLSCSCEIYDDPPAWWYEPPSDFTKFDVYRRKRCSSCKKLIEIGADCGKFLRWRSTRSDIEERIYGEDGEIHLASMYHCEECAGLYFAFLELGYECVAPNENMRGMVEEYNE